MRPLGLYLGFSRPGGAVFTPAPTTSETSVTSNTVTFNFAAARDVGQYVTGDYFVVVPAAGNVTISSTSPASAQHSGLFADGVTAFTNEWLNGAMTNPAVGTTGYPSTVLQGFNSIDTGDTPVSATTIQDYGNNVDPGATGSALVLTTAASIVKAKGPTASLPNDGRTGMTTDMAVLTAVSAVPAADAFRPHPSSTDKASYFTLADMNLSFLPGYALPGGATAITHATALARVQKVYQTFFTNNLFTRGHNPTNHHQSYGRDISMDLGEVFLYLCLSSPTAPQKAEIGKYCVQIGLDIINRAISGGTWGPATGSFGGGQHWVKAIAIFAAKALEGAANTAKAGELQEWVDPLLHTFASEDRIFGTVTRTYVETYPTQRSGFPNTQYPNYAENAPLWNSKPSDPAASVANWKHAYRANVLGSILGGSLAMRMMGLTADYLAPYFDYMDMWYDYSKTDVWTPDAPTAFTQAMLDEYWDNLSPRYLDAAAPSIVRTVARDFDVWFEFDKMLSRTAIPANTAFAVLVDGVAATVTSVAANTTTEPYSLQTPNIYGYSLAVKLAATIPAGATVTIAYTQPGSNKAATLGGALVPTIAATAATNLTGTLPSAAASKDIVSTGAGVAQADRQYSLAPVPTAMTIERMRLSFRFWLDAAPAANDTFLSSGTGSSTAFRLYASTTADLRLLIGSEQFRMPGSVTALPLDKLITMHLAVDYTATTTDTRYKITFVWNGGSHSPLAGASSTVVTTATTKAIATIWQSGIGVGAIPTITFSGGTNAMNGGYSELTIGWGAASYALPANFSGSEFAWNASWGNNGELVWGQNQRYYAGTLAEWNTSVPNRGSGSPSSMSPKRLTDADTLDLTTAYTVAAI